MKQNLCYSPHFLTNLMTMTALIDYIHDFFSRYYEPFVAHFLPGSDQEFFVKPQSGELPPFYTKGIVIIVGFKPRMYSKKYQATLVIQVSFRTHSF